MNREQLTKIISEQIHDYTEHDPLDFVDALWPVLAQVWAEGYIDGFNDCDNAGDEFVDKVPNPYRGQT